MMGLTTAQARCLDYLKRYIADHGRAPSMQALGNELDTGQSNAYRLVLALEERGYVRRIPRRARAIEIIEPGAAVRLSPEIERAVAKHARGASLETATNELLREYLGMVAA